DLLRPGEDPAALAVGLLERIGDRTRADALARLSLDTKGPYPPTPELRTRLDSAWRDAARTLTPLSDRPPNRRFHLDLEMAMREAVVDRRTVDDLVGAVRRLEALFGAPSYLTRFRQAFRQRYEDAEVPLLDALDLENGVVQASEREVSPLAELAGVRAPQGSGASESVPPGVVRVLERWIRGEDPVDIQDLPAVEHSS